MPNLDRKFEDGPRPIEPEGMLSRHAEKQIKKIIKVLGVTFFSTFVVSNALDYNNVRQELEKGKNPEKIEQAIREYSSNTGWRFLDEISRPGRELAYYLHETPKKPDINSYI